MKKLSDTLRKFAEEDNRFDKIFLDYMEEKKDLERTLGRNAPKIIVEILNMDAPHSVSRGQNAFQG